MTQAAAQTSTESPSESPTESPTEPTGTLPRDDWISLVRPGRAPTFFAVADPPRLPEAQRFSPVVAWWCAECCRVIYRSKHESAGGPTRQDFLADAGWIEHTTMSEQPRKYTGWFRGEGVRCAIMASRDERQPALVVVRGSANLRNWLANLTVLPSDWPHGGKVHQGFAVVLDALWDRLENVVDELGDRPFYVTGHSLGGAIALLASDRFAAQQRPIVGTYLFGTPRVGDPTFADVRRRAVYRVVNHRDLVTDVPPRAGLMRFNDVGQLVYIDREGTVHPNADSNDVTKDRAKSWPPDWRLDPWIGRKPPRYLSDHSPVNYVAYLERCLPSL